VLVLEAHVQLRRQLAFELRGLAAGYTPRRTLVVRSVVRLLVLGNPSLLCRFCDNS
jgi:hypothetical protein